MSILQKALDKMDYSSFSFSDYFHGEQTIMLPYLKNLGYTNIQFSTGEQDSFGPLTRKVSAVKDNKSSVAYYG